MKKLVLVVMILGLLILTAFAGEKEEIDYQIAYWQEHLKVLQMDFELSQNRLKEAIAKKQAFDKKLKEETENKEKK